MKAIGAKLLILATLFSAIGGGLILIPHSNRSSASTLNASSTPASPSNASSSNRDSNPYLDDRSTPIQVLRSYYNAINRKEYVRAYYYWFTPGNSSTSEPPDYNDFADGYANTVSVRLTTGKVISDAAAGTVYYQVPAVLTATHTDGTSVRYAGCFRLKQPQPLNFGAPPFEPLGIDSADLRQVSGNASTASLLTASCPAR